MIRLNNVARERLILAQAAGLVRQDTEESLIEIIIHQDIVSESNNLCTFSFDIDDLLVEV